MNSVLKMRSNLGYQRQRQRQKRQKAGVGARDVPFRVTGIDFAQQTMGSHGRANSLHKTPSGCSGKETGSQEARKEAAAMVPVWDDRCRAEGRRFEKCSQITQGLLISDSGWEQRAEHSALHRRMTRVLSCLHPQVYSRWPCVGSVAPVNP